MKLPCKLIDDLLPLYHDNVCSQESRTFVEEHLKDCEACRTQLSKLTSETEDIPRALEEAKPLKALRSAWEKGKKRSFIKGVLIAVLLCTVLVGGYLGLTAWKIIPVSPALIEVSEVSMLSDGRIIYHLNIKDNKNLHFIKFTTNEDGSYYQTPMRSIIEGKRSADKGLFNEYFMIDIAENNAYQQNFGDGIEITSCYIGPKDKGILIWQEGMELPAASEALEQMILGEN
ncbi:MAG: zf-HC2 domain-containing protein [Mobilitalea sp.]